MHTAGAAAGAEATATEVVHKMVVIDIAQPFDDIQHQTLSKCENDVEWMFSFSFLGYYTYKPFRYAVPILANTILIAGTLAPIWYPTYYVQQYEFWTAHLAIAIPYYNYIWYLRGQWGAKGFFEHIDIHKWNRILSLSFFWLYMLYWAYFSGVMIYENHTESIGYQFGNILMSIAWYIFFSVASTAYYYVTIIMLQRATEIRRKIKTMHNGIETKVDFFKLYNKEYKTNRNFGRAWNRIIFIVILVLFFNIPVDLIAILYRRYYYDIPGVFIKLIGLTWFIITICKLNHMDTYMKSFLQKHHLLQADMEEITRYTAVRPLSLNFYGITITYEYITKVILISVNLIIPTIYGLISNKIM